MKFLKAISTYVLDFLFPKSASLAALEALTPRELQNILPQAKDSKDNLIIIFDYKDKTVRELIWELKYRGNRNIARKCAEILFDVLSAELSERALYDNFNSPLLIPMPTSSLRRRERGYNPTEIICEEIKKLDTANLFQYNNKILTKEIHTASMARTHATKDERKENILNSMKVSESNILNKRCVVLIDDVTTSGITFKEAKRALSGARAKKILCVAIAH